MIVKVQIPVATNVPDAPSLIYNRDRSVMEQFPITQTLLAAMDGELKQFFYAHMEGEKLILDERAPWQAW